MGFNAVAAPWTDSLWARLEKLCPLPDGLLRLPDTPRPFRWNVRCSDVQTSVDEAVLEDIYADCTDPVFDRPFVTNVVVRIFAIFNIFKLLYEIIYCMYCK